MSSLLELQSKLFPVKAKARSLTHNMGVTSCFQLKPEWASDESCSDGEKSRMEKLQRPKELYSTASLQHPPKWPVECQVLEEKVYHADRSPKRLEGFYAATNTEPQPQPVGEDMGSIIYCYQPKLCVDYFCHSRAGGSGELEPCHSTNDSSSTLKFESRFESGNLEKVIKISNVYYELYLRPDMYTEKHTQWFYFRVQNMQENVLYRFSIVNLNKADSLYKYGLKPLLYSEKDAQLRGKGWTRCGNNITYFKNDLSLSDSCQYYTLTFTIKFKYGNDTVYIAQCYPYTYSTLQTYLLQNENNHSKSSIFTVRLLCRSLAGNNVYVVTITSPENYLHDSIKRPAIVISARVHPGETQSSYMMKGIIDFLTSHNSQAKTLRERFVFKLIPMLNPDGVVVGNSRCCLLGHDLNRQYGTVLREAFPQIYQFKVMLRRLMEENGIFLYCDLHGHSRKNNAFMYGCENRRIPEKRLIEQVFPLMMHKNAADKFNFQSCKFRIQKTKEGTARVFAWTLGVVNSYTLEISLGGSTMPSRSNTHFHVKDYEAIGRHFCETLLDFSDPDDDRERLRMKILKKLSEKGSNADEPQNVPLSDYSSLSHSETEEENDGMNNSESERIFLQESKTRKKSILKKTTYKRMEEKRMIKTGKDVYRYSPKRKETVSIVSFKTSIKEKASEESQERKTERIFNEEFKDYEEGFEKKSQCVSGKSEVLKREGFMVYRRLTRVKKAVPNKVGRKGVGGRKGERSSPRYTRVLIDDPFKVPKCEQSEAASTTEENSSSEDECDVEDKKYNKISQPGTGKIQTSDPQTLERFSELSLCAQGSNLASASSATGCESCTEPIKSKGQRERKEVNLRKGSFHSKQPISYKKAPTAPKAQKIKTLECSDYNVTTNALQHILPTEITSARGRRISWTVMSTNSRLKQKSSKLRRNSSFHETSINSSSEKPGLTMKCIKNSKSFEEKTKRNKKVPA